MINLRTLLLAAVVAVSATGANANYINLTTSGSSGTLNGALFQEGASLSGTGIFPSFVQVTGNDPVHDAYNTTVNKVLDNGSADQHNHEIQVSDLTTTKIGPTTYYNFYLDINENDNAAGDQYLSLDQLRIFTGGAPNSNTTDVTDPSPLGTLRYDMDAGNPNNVVLLNYDLETGSGRADMHLLVPVSDFNGASGSDYVYLYSSFGALGALDLINAYGNAPAGNYGASDGFEEWAYSVVTTVPEPMTITLFGTGLLGLLGMRRRRGLHRRASSP